jgi:hypothetical protein
VTNWFGTFRFFERFFGCNTKGDGDGDVDSKRKLEIEIYTVKKVIDFPVPIQDVTEQTLPGRD